MFETAARTTIPTEGKSRMTLVMYSDQKSSIHSSTLCTHNCESISNTNQPTKRLYQHHEQNRIQITRVCHYNPLNRTETYWNSFNDILRPSLPYWLDTNTVCWATNTWELCTCIGIGKSSCLEQVYTFGTSYYFLNLVLSSQNKWMAIIIQTQRRFAQ